MATRAQAQLAKGALSARLAGRSWLRGVGLEGSGDDYRVRVNVEFLSPDVLQTIPSRIDDVEVSIAAVGDISAQSEGAKST